MAQLAKITIQYDGRRPRWKFIESQRHCWTVAEIGYASTLCFRGELRD